MKLKALLQDVELKDELKTNPEITNITDSTEKIRRSGAFVCIRGEKTDGHRYAHEALKRGAAVIICEYDIGIENSVIVSDTRKAYALMCAAFYGSCHKKLSMIGITGTNGKTTTSYILKKILDDAGYRTGLIGTVSVIIGDEKYPADLTTPDPADLHRYLMLMNIAGCDVCIMEVSSQALIQQRVYGICFDCGIFTNLSSEHLDYHRTPENYRQAKRILFENSKSAVLNGDDACCDYMGRVCRGRTFTYGRTEADITAEKIKLSCEGVSYTLKTPEDEYPVSFEMMGEFNVYNSLAALSAAYLTGVNMDRAVRSVSRFEGISGRMEKVPNNLGINIIIDFAHTPDSLECVLKTLRQVYGGRLITVFGCGGDRDREKRPIMGRTACEYSDKVFVTSDNSRTEKPEDIINEITQGLESDKVFKITDRTLALKSAVNSAKSGDTLLVAGKGHEKYQITGTQKIYFNEREILKKLLEDKARF